MTKIPKEVQIALQRKNAKIEPFVYVPCKNLPGMIAIPLNEAKIRS